MRSVLSDWKKKALCLVNDFQIERQETRKTDKFSTYGKNNI
jgi:hypothetical protein